MKQLFKIDESEKKRILEMHENATKRNYLMEEGVTKGCLTNPTRTEFSKEINAMGGETNLCKILGAEDSPLVGDTFLGDFYFKGYVRESTPEVKVYQVTTKFGLKEFGTFRNLKNGQGWFLTGQDEIYSPISVVPKDGKIDDMPASEILTLIEKTADTYKLDSTKYLQFLTSLVKTNEFYRKTLEYIVNFAKSATAEQVRKDLTQMLQGGRVRYILQQARMEPEEFRKTIKPKDARFPTPSPELKM